MGCLESRDKKNYEQIFNEIDFRLKFNYLSLETLKNVLSFLYKKNNLIFSRRFLELKTRKSHIMK